MPWQGLFVVALACAGVWLLAGMPWALITVAALLLLDLVTDSWTERSARGRVDRPS